MALSQSTVVFFAVIAIMAIFSTSPVQAKTVPIIPEAAEEIATAREGRFYGGYPMGGTAGASANAFASSNSFGLGGGGLGIASSQATASAGAGGIGFPYGK